MARSYAHTFGQIIGGILEAAMEPFLETFANRYDLFLDKKGARLARKGKKVTWLDLYGNAHDIDYVLERAGTAEKIGEPIAFIETAWRRYTKHSRNKAQEIQGAVGALTLTHKYSSPFLGAVLAGFFTEGAVTQLRSLGFHVLYFPYPSILSAFQKVGINASFDEATSESEFARKIKRWKRLKKEQRRLMASSLAKMHDHDIAAFFVGLEKSISKKIIAVIVVPLHGIQANCGGISEAISFLMNYNPETIEGPALEYELHLKYSNGDKINAEFENKQDAIQFLNRYGF
ncbi:MAG: DNA methylase [bacterium]